MGFGDWLSDVGDDFAKGIAQVAHYGNTLDRYINPFHVEAGSSQYPVTQEDHQKYDRVAGIGVNTSVEAFGAASVYLRDQYLYHPVSTVILQAKRMGGWRPGQEVPYFSTADWASAWKAADNITPGQASLLGRTSIFDNPNDPNVAVEAQKAIESPLEYYTPSLAELPPEFANLNHEQQQALLKKAGMPVVGNRYVEELRKSSKFYWWASGTGDFALTWYADPLIVAGKGIGAANRARKVYKPEGGEWTRQSIDKLMNDSRFGKVMDDIWAHKDNPQYLNNLDIAANSAMGPRFGNIVSQLKSPEELNLFLRTTLGDLDAMDKLVGRNIQVEARLASANERLAALDLTRTRWLHNPHVQRQVTQQIADLEKRINDDVATKLRYNQIVDHADELDKVYVGNWQARKAAAKTEAQNAYRAGAAYGYKASRPGRFTPTPGLLGISKSWRGPATPIDGGMIRQTVWGAGDFFSKPVTVIRALKEAHPNGWISIDDITKDSVAELRAHAARIPNITPEVRENILNAYLKTTTEGERMALLDDLDNLAWSKVAQKHGMDPKVGQELFQAYRAKRIGEQAAKDEAARAYGATKIEGQSGRELRVDEFEAGGGRLVIHPHTVTRLRNSQVLAPIDEIDKVLARHSSALSALRTAWAGNPDWIIHASEFLTSVFKVSVLTRLGYVPRVLGDDLGSQWAAAGAAAMALRFGWGVRNGATNMARAFAAPWQAAKEQSALQGINYAKAEIKIAEQQNKAIRAQLKGQVASDKRDLARAQVAYTKAEAKYRALDPADRSPKAMAVRQFHSQRLSQLRQANNRVAAGPSKGRTLYAAQQDARILWLRQFQQLNEQKVADLASWREVRRQGFTDPVYIDGKKMKVAFEGKEGEYTLAQISADQSVGNIFASNKQLLNGNIQRSFDHGGRVIRAAEDETEHAAAWAKAINNQIIQDPLERLAVHGATEKQLAQWLRRTAEGRQYRQRIGLKMATPEALAQRAKAEVDEYLPMWEIREAALAGEISGDFLRKVVPRADDRPEVHTGMMGMQSQGGFQSGVDRIQQMWFHVAATVPANRLSRHPLFNQLYEGHLKQITDRRTAQGGWTVSDIDQITTASRRLATRDMRKLVFDIAHRSDAAAALRFISPFFGATSEAFQRWGRIIADKPQVAGYAADFFNAPISAGMLQDGEGNHIIPGGYRMVKDAKTGKWKKEIVPKNERWIVGRAPQWVVDSPLGAALGMERSSGNFALSQNSMNLVTQGDPWFHPGFGPVVQIPVNKFVADKPEAAKIARQLSVLPFGPQEGSSSFVTPSTIRNFMTAFNTSDERYQSIKMQILQREIYDFSNRHERPPTQDEITRMQKNVADKTQQYWLWSAVSAFTQPFATQRRDAYQFYRDQYNELRRLNPETADAEYLDRFGESHFIFAQSQSKNETGVPATEAAFALQQKYAGLLRENPELGALIIGPDGKGPFSPEVYAYQLNNPLSPGDNEMQRTKISAEEAMLENQRRAGWTTYLAYMNRLNADLQKRGLTSFEDVGAEDLKARKSALVTALGSPTLPDGSVNPSYNEEWSKDFYSFDVRKTDRMAASLTKLVNSPLAKDERRGDIRVLKTYLDGRKEILAALAQRKGMGGAGTLGAKKNADLFTTWNRFVTALVESDTNFGDLYHRYLSRDLGVDMGLEDQEVS